MSYSNRIFRVNGVTKKDLELTLALAINQVGEHKSITAYEYLPEKGIVFHWSNSEKRYQNFLHTPTAEHLAEMLYSWIHTNDDAKKAKLIDGFENNFDHDGHNEIGFMVYTENYGQIEGSTYSSMFAVKRVYIQYGK